MVGTGGYLRILYWLIQRPRTAIVQRDTLVFASSQGQIFQKMLMRSMKTKKYVPKERWFHFTFYLCLLNASQLKLSRPASWIRRRTPVDIFLVKLLRAISWFEQFFQNPSDRKASRFPFAFRFWRGWWLASGRGAAASVWIPADKRRRRRRGFVRFVPLHTRGERWHVNFWWWLICFHDLSLACIVKLYLYCAKVSTDWRETDNWATRWLPLKGTFIDLDQYCRP